jgi:hypothetical protein
MRVVKLKKMKRIGGVHFTPDGLTAAAGGEKGQVVFWDVE